MTTLEERVAGVEGRVQEQSRSIGGLSEQITTLDRRIASFEERVDRRFEAMAEMAHAPGERSGDDGMLEGAAE
jgi:uncharacterized coiled-coil protein SlyX